MKHKESVSGDWKGLRLHTYSVWHDPEVQRLTPQMRSSFPCSSWLSFGLHIIAHNCSGWVCCYLGLKEVSDKHAMQDSESSMLCRHKTKTAEAPASNIGEIMRTQKHEISISLRGSKRQAFCYISRLSDDDEDSLFATVLAVHQVCDGLIVTLISNPC